MDRAQQCPVAFCILLQPSSEEERRLGPQRSPIAASLRRSFDMCALLIYRYRLWPHSNASSLSTPGPIINPYGFYSYNTALLCFVVVFLGLVSQYLGNGKSTGTVSRFLKGQRRLGATGGVDGGFSSVSVPKEVHLQRRAQRRGPGCLWDEGLREEEREKGGGCERERRTSP